MAEDGVQRVIGGHATFDTAKALKVIDPVDGVGPGVAILGLKRWAGGLEQADRVGGIVQSAIHPNEISPIVKVIAVMLGHQGAVVFLDKVGVKAEVE